MTVPGTAVQVSVGRQHACAVNSARAVYCWGQNDEGQLGDGTLTDRPTPVRAVGVLADQTSAGYLHTCARDGATIKCWGANTSQELGVTGPARSTTAVAVTVTTGLEYLAEGSRTPCAATSTDLWCWGENHRGQAGRNPGTFNLTTSPVRVANFPLLATISADSTTVAYSNPGGGPAVRIAHSCAAVADGRVYCWGAIPPIVAEAQLYQARQVPGITDVTSIAAGELGSGAWGPYYTFTCASVTAGDVLCWGSTADNFLQTGDTGTITVPSRVIDLPPTTPPIPR